MQPSEVMGTLRTEDHVLARRLFVYLCWYHLGWGIRETARFLGRSPSAISHAVRQCEFELKYDRRMIRIHAEAVRALVGVR